MSLKSLLAEEVVGGTKYYRFEDGGKYILVDCDMDVLESRGLSDGKVFELLTSCKQLLRLRDTILKDENEYPYFNRFNVYEGIKSICIEKTSKFKDSFSIKLVHWDSPEVCKIELESDGSLVFENVKVNIRNIDLLVTSLKDLSLDKGIVCNKEFKS